MNQIKFHFKLWNCILYICISIHVTLPWMIGSWMRSISTYFTLDFIIKSYFVRTFPVFMPFFLTILTIILLKRSSENINLHVVDHLLLGKWFFLSSKNFSNNSSSLLNLFICICLEQYMKLFIIFILLFFTLLWPPSSDRNFASCFLFKFLLSGTFWTYDHAYIVLIRVKLKLR